MKAKHIIAASVMGLAALVAARGAPAPADETLAREIFDTMKQVPGVHPGFRVVHAKGLVCQGTFEPTPEAAELSKAAHFQAPVPVTVRFSAGSPDPMIPDNTGGSGPRGMAIRFTLPGGDDVDIVAMSHNGFVVSTGEEFLALQKAIVATDPAKPHPWPVEAFLGAHPLALKFVQENATTPASFAAESFFSNNAFTFVNKAGVKQVGRYKILPVGGEHHLTPDEAKTKGSNFLSEDLQARLAKEPVKYKLIVQLPNPGDVTKDPSLVWPEDRKTVAVGILSVKSVVADSDDAQKRLAFDPTNLTDGIDLSDDPFPALRSQVYALAVKFRRQPAK